MLSAHFPSKWQNGRDQRKHSAASFQGILVLTIKTKHNCDPMPTRLKSSKGFTLLELMVVILVIATLMALAVPVYQGVLERARKVQAKNDVTQIVTAINAYYTEYGKYPVAADDTPITDNGTLFNALRAVTGSDSDNLRKIVFISPPNVKSDTVGTRRGGVSPTDGNYYDPWGNSYRVAIDGTYDNQIANPYNADSGAGPSQLRQGVIVWSLGKDNMLGKAGDSVFTGSDDVISWQ